MEQETHKPPPRRVEPVHNLFFMMVLAALIGCTLFSGGAAIMIASGILNEIRFEVAQAQ
jgi:hypothetical protein